MSYLFKLSIAVAIGLAAAFTNWFYMSTSTRPTTFVAAAKSLKMGQEIKEDDLKAVPVPGDIKELSQSLVPFSSRAILLGRKASRNYLSGDVVFSRDLVADTDGSRWDVIGPFELISVGERLKSPPVEDGSAIGSMSGDTVTIAVDADFDEPTSRLLSVIAGEAMGSRDTSGNSDQQVEIVAVQVVPVTGLGAAKRAGARNARDQVYQTISLRGIPNVPKVLLEGDVIRFVVPKTGY